MLSERWAATPEHERAYPPEEAIRLLVLYVGVSIAIGSRCYDRSLLVPLPGMLEPFAPLAPVIEAVRINALATLDVGCDSRLEQGRALWKDVYARLMQIDPVQLPAVTAFRGAVAYAIGLVEGRLGLGSATEWAELLDRDPAQHVNALYLRKVSCLHHGDFEGAERLSKQAEILALQSPTRPDVHERGRGRAVGARRVRRFGRRQGSARTHRPAERTPPGLGRVRLLAEAQFEALRGDLDTARELFERCLPLCTPDPQHPHRRRSRGPRASGSYVEVLLRQGHYEQARRVAEDALEVCRQNEIGLSSHEISRGLALAEARLGDYAAAWHGSSV